MRVSLVSLADWLICCAVWMAVMTGLVTATLRPLCLNWVSVWLFLVSLASRMSTFLALMVMLPTGAMMSLPVWV